MPPRTELPWDSINRQVTHATLSYMHTTHGSIKQFITIKFLADYLDTLEEPESRQYKHLCGVPWKTICTRCTMSMRKMGWVGQSRGVFVVPKEKVRRVEL